MILRWNHAPTRSMDTIGPNYYLRLKTSSWFESAHVFTTFENRSGILLFGGHPSSNQWSVATVIRVFRNKRVPQLGPKDAYSHTMQMYEVERLDVTTWGPKQSEMSGVVKNELLTSIFKSTPLILIASGSGINYILDALQWCTGNLPTGSKALSLLYTTRDEALLEWVKQAIAKLLPSTASSSDDDSQSIRVVLALTSSNIPACLDNLNAESKTAIQTQTGRLDLDKEVVPGASVFCQGSGILTDTVAAICRCRKATFSGGRGGRG
jgi:hypothetical protein